MLMLVRSMLTLSAGSILSERSSQTQRTAQPVPKMVAGEQVGLTEEERRQRKAELQAAQAEKEQKMAALKAEVMADRTQVRHHPVSFDEGASNVAHEAGMAVIRPAAEDAGAGAPAGTSTANPAAAAAARAAAARAAAASATAPCAAAPLRSATGAQEAQAAMVPRLCGDATVATTPRAPLFQVGGINEEERRRRAAEIKQQQTERAEARRKIAAEFRADHSHTSGAGAAVQTTSSDLVAVPSSSATSASLENVTTCLVQVRLPNGEIKQRQFLASDLLSEVADWAQLLLRQNGTYETCKLVLPPRQVLGAAEAAQTIRDLNLLPRVSFNLQLQSEQGRITSAPRAGAEFEAAFRAEVTHMLEFEGFTAWEAGQWGALVEGQLQRGEMRKVRANVRALFGGLRLPTTIGAWAARVDQAPSVLGPPQVLVFPII